MAVVFVVNRQGKPLMPTERCGHVRHLLKAKKAVVISTIPFTIRLKYDGSDETQNLILGIDPGRTNIGVSVVTDTGKCVFSANAETNNKDVPKHMAERKAHRMASRRGERLRRQRRAVASGTCFTEIQRVLPQCKEPITCKSIKNSEARFCNRRRPDGWLTPTANHLLQCHVNLVKKLQKFLPITAVVLEMNAFAFMAMDNPSIQRWQYQRGQLYGLGSVEDAVNLSQDGHCLFCDGKIDHYHHVVPRSKGGSETLPNRVGLCSEHHVLVHTDDVWTAKLTALKDGLNKKYGALSVLNPIIPSMAAELADMFSGNCCTTSGRDTAAFRLANGIAKDHQLDAYCVACATIADTAVSLPTESFALHRFRRHDRAVISRQEERKYYLNKQLVARNRHKRMEQKSPSLEELRIAQPTEVGKLSVVKGTAKNKDPRRILPGAIYMVDGMRMVLQGRHGKTKKGQPNYLEFFGHGNFTPKHCEFISKGQGWQFI